MAQHAHGECGQSERMQSTALDFRMKILQIIFVKNRIVMYFGLELRMIDRRKSSTKSILFLSHEPLD